MAKIKYSRSEAVYHCKASQSLNKFTDVVDFCYNIDKGLRNAFYRMAKNKLDGKEEQYKKAKDAFIAYIAEHKLDEKTQEIAKVLKMVKYSSKLAIFDEKIKNVLREKEHHHKLLELLLKYESLEIQGKEKRKEREELYYKIMEALAHS